MNERETKELALLAIQERRRRRRAAPLKYFVPHPGQRRAIDAMHNHRGVIMKPGNRFGKSTLAGAVAVCYSYGYWIFDVPDLKLTPEGDYPPRDQIHPSYWMRRADGLEVMRGNAGLGEPVRSEDDV